MLAATPSALAQSFLAQCPDVTGTASLANPVVPTVGNGGTSLHPYDSHGVPLNGNGHIKCQQVVGGDGYATMADGNQIYMFSFGPASGLDLISQGMPGTQDAADFNQVFNSQYLADGKSPDPTWQQGVPQNRNAALRDPTQIMTWGVLSGQQPAPLIAIDEDDELFLTLSNVGMIMRPDLFEQHTIHFHGYPQASSYFDGVPDASVAIAIAGSMTYYYTAPEAGTYFFHCHITPPEHLQMGMVGQLYVRPRQNKVPVYNAALPAAGQTLYSALAGFQSLNSAQASQTHATIPTRCYDGTGASPDSDPANPNHGAVVDLTCATPLPAADNGSTHAVYNYTLPAGAPAGYTLPANNGQPMMYAYNDGDASTAYDVEYPIQMMGFDPNFHYVGMTFNPEDFAGMKDKYFMLSGRSYPDTTQPVVAAVDASNNPFPGLGTQHTQDSDGLSRPSQPMPSLIHIQRSAGQKRALLRVSDLSVTEEQTLGTIGVPMTVIAWNARELRDMAGYDTAYQSNSITLGGGESADVILDVSGAQYQNCSKAGTAGTAPCHFFLYSTNLDHLSNDAENFGGAMTEILVD
ncbi:MAG: multicopper oxidase domain-containing protein [Pseudomonadota bacterium]|nr:multicopper oxidase domain-containing protein [Pseudomonadota bacterium]